MAEIRDPRGSPNGVWAFRGGVARGSRRRTSGSRPPEAAALARSKVPHEAVDHVVFGNVVQSSSDAVYLARHVGLGAGVRVDCPALTVNRLCGSGLRGPPPPAPRLIQLGEAEVVLAGGNRET